MIKTIEDHIIGLFEGKRSVSGINCPNIDIAKDTSNDYLTRIIALSNHWSDFEEEIMESISENPIYHHMGNCFDYSTIFTPIEYDFWCSMKCIGGIYFYPQYKVLNYICDFVNPYHKIIIELDGKEYHVDKEKDLRRDLSLGKEGWSIIRITGSDMFKSAGFDECDVLRDFDYGNIDEDEMYKKLCQYYLTGDGIVRSLRYIYWQSEYHNDIEMRASFKGLQENCTYGFNRIIENYFNKKRHER